MSLKKLFEEVLALESPVNIEFKEQLSLIQDPDKKRVVENVLRTVSMENVEGAASSSGKYHPQFAQGKKGLSRHTKAVISFAADICEAFPELNKDTMIIAALMHDMCKYKEGAKHTNKEHAQTISNLLKKEGLDDESRMTLTHMGRWDKDVGAPSKFDEKMLHLADYLASRTWIDIDFDENDNIVTSNDDSRRKSKKLDDAEGEVGRLKYVNDFLLGKNEGF